MLLWPGLVWLAVTIAWELSGFDLAASDLVACDTGGFPAKHAWWARGLLHDWSKPVIPVVASICLLTTILSIWWQRLRPWWLPALAVALTIGISTGIVGLLKDTTNRHPPWSLQRYGGEVPHTELWEGPAPGFDRASGKPSGEGWPAGHASGGFALIGLWFVARRMGTRRAWLWALPAILLGGAFALAQHWRGAHFLSHNLYSIAICWTVGVLIDRFASRRARRTASCRTPTSSRSSTASSWQCLTARDPRPGWPGATRRW